MVEGIEREGGMTLTAIERKGKIAKISPGMIDAAVTKLHRRKDIKVGNKLGDLFYTSTEIKPPAPRTPISHIQWMKDHYPPMTSSNDGSGIDADYSFMFLKPEDLDKFKADVAGRVYIPKKRYQKANKKLGL